MRRLYRWGPIESPRGAAEGADSLLTVTQPERFETVWNGPDSQYDSMNRLAAIVGNSTSPCSIYAAAVLAFVVVLGVGVSD